MARATTRKGQVGDESSRLVPEREERGSTSGPSTAVPPGATGGLVLGDLPGPATAPEFGESVDNVVHDPVGAQPHFPLNSSVSGPTTTNYIAIVSISSPAMPLILSLSVSAVPSLSNVHDHPPLTSVCYELGLGVPKQIQEKIWNGEYIDFGALFRPARSGFVNNTPQDCVLLIGSTESPTWQICPPTQHTRITSIEQWTSAFLVFASIYLVRHPDQARQLLSYANTVRSAAFRRAGCGWRDYDIQFRFRQARLPSSH